MFSIAAAPFYIPSNSSEEFQICPHSCQHLLFSGLAWLGLIWVGSSYPDEYDMVSQCGSDLHLHDVEHLLMYF